jgi:hypothetical protein
MGCSSSVPEDVTTSPQDISIAVTDTMFPPSTHEDAVDNSSKVKEPLDEEEVCENIHLHANEHVSMTQSRSDEESIAPAHEVVFIYIYEYERHQPELGWGNSFPGHLLPSDKGRFSNEGGSLFSTESVTQVVDPCMRSWELDLLPHEQECSEVHVRWAPLIHSII